MDIELGSTKHFIQETNEIFDQVSEFNSNDT